MINQFVSSLQPRIAKKVGILPKPFLMTYLMTSKCNARCKTCNIWTIKKNNDLSLEELESFLESKYLKRIQFVGFSGGEPFLRKDFVDVSKLFLEKLKLMKSIRVTTNGLLSKRINEKVCSLLKEGVPVSLKLSLDGLGTIHDNIRGVPGAFSRVNKTISLLKKLDTKYNDKLDLTIGFTISKYNYKHLIDVANFTLEKGFDFFYKPAVSGYLFKKNNPLFNPRQKKIIDHQIKLIEKMPFRKNDSFNSLIRKAVNKEFKKMVKKYLKNPGQRAFPCYALRSSFILNFDGEVFPCMVLEKPVGNIRSQDFDSIWASKNAKETRQWIDQDKCSCITSCDSYPSIYCSKLLNISTNLLTEVFR